MVDLLGRRARHDQLIDLRRCGRQHGVDIQVWAADFAVGLDRQHALQQVNVFGVLVGQVLLLDYVSKHKNASRSFSLKRSTALREPAQPRKFAKKVVAEFVDPAVARSMS